MAGSCSMPALAGFNGFPCPVSLRTLRTRQMGLPTEPLSWGEAGPSPTDTRQDAAPPKSCKSCRKFSVPRCLCVSLLPFQLECAASVGSPRSFASRGFAAPPKTCLRGKFFAFLASFAASTLFNVREAGFNGFQCFKTLRLSAPLRETFFLFNLRARQDAAPPKTCLRGKFLAFLAFFAASNPFQSPHLIGGGRGQPLSHGQQKARRARNPREICFAGLRGGSVRLRATIRARGRCGSSGRLRGRNRFAGA